MRKLCLTLLFLCPLASHADDSNFPGVEGLMTPEEYQAAGMDTLSEEQRKARNAWLIRYTAWEAPAQRRQSVEVKEELKEDIVANVQGAFSGWSGKTRFVLDNGQVWEQRIGGRFVYNGSDKQVSISKNFLGYYILEHVASGRTVGVKRID